MIDGKRWNRKKEHWKIEIPRFSYCSSGSISSSNTLPHSTGVDGLLYSEHSRKHQYPQLFLCSEKAQWKINRNIFQLDKKKKREDPQQAEKRREWREDVSSSRRLWSSQKGQRRENLLKFPACPPRSLLAALFFWELPRNWSWGGRTAAVVVRERPRWLVCVQARESPT